MGNRPRTAQPGDLMLSPPVVTAVLVLLVNDHVLKDRYPGAISGKLSDLAGLFFFPVLLVSAGELGATWVTRRPRFVGPKALAACLLAVAAVFAMSKVGGSFEQPYEQATGILRWPITAATNLAAGDPAGPVTRTDLTRDGSDLWTLPAVAAAGLLIYRHRSATWGSGWRLGQLDRCRSAGEQVADEVQLEP